MRGPIIGALLLSSVIAKTQAQKISKKRDTTISYSGNKYEVKTNRFFSNWFIGGGIGTQLYFGDHNKQEKFGDRLSQYFHGFAGKWFSPGIGVRIGLDGFKIVGLTQNGSHSTGERYNKIPWDGYWLTKQEFKYWHVHGDVLFNLSNILYGYKEDRLYTISPYVGLGWMVTNDDPKAKEVSANLGVYNTLRLNKALDLTLDIRGAMVNDRFDGETGHRKNEGPLSVSLGLTYKFKQRGWEKPSNIIIRETYDESELNEILNRLKQLETDNDALRKLLEDSKNNSITNLSIRKNMLAAPILITFPINKSTVSNEARVNLGFFAKLIKEINPNFVYTITGYADKGTGTPMINERLSKERTEAIYNILVKEFGVNSQQLRKYHKGGVENMFYNDPRLSRAVITIADILTNEKIDKPE